MVLQMGQRGAIEFRIAADVAFGIDERHAAAEPAAGQCGKLRPLTRVGRCELGEQPCFTLQLVRDLGFEMAA